MHVEICDHCEVYHPDRPRLTPVAIKTVRRLDNGQFHDDGWNQEDWCDECIAEHFTPGELTATDNGGWLQGTKRGTFVRTFTLENDDYWAEVLRRQRRKEAPPTWMYEPAEV